MSTAIASYLSARVAVFSTARGRSTHKSNIAASPRSRRAVVALAGPSQDAAKETALAKPFEVSFNPRYSAVIQRTRDARRARTSSSRAAPPSPPAAR